MLAITLLNNANLEDGTFTNAKLQLIAHAEARNKKKESSVIDTEMVSKANLNDVLKIAEKMKKVDVPLGESDSTPDEYKKALSGFRSQTISFIRSLDVAVEDLKVAA